MTDYTKTTNFATKDALPSGNANKIVKGTEINTEFDNIATAVATKSNTASPTFTGVVSFPDGSASDPSITNTGDTNVGLFFSAGDTLAFTAGGTSQFTMADGVIAPVTDSDVDLGTSSLYFKNAYIDSVTTTGNITIGGNLDVDGTLEFDSLSGTGTTAVTDILDQDDMSGNSATALATQQSIKAYVDAQQDTVDTFGEVLALSNTTGGTDISVSTDDKVQFRDSAIYINSSADGQLDIVADTEIQIAATTIDINGAVALNGAVTGATNVTLSGELDAATGDFSGAVDIDGALDVAGTTNLDVVDIDGATQIDATVSVGVDDTGYDVKFFGDTASAFMEWDASTDDLILGGAGGLIVPEGQFTLGSTAVTSTAAELNILDGATVVVGEINALDLGDTAVGTAIASKAVILDSNKDYTGIRNLTISGELGAGSLDISGDVDIDGTLETDALSINGTTVTASAADINLIDGITNGTVIANKVIITDVNKDITGGRNITISGELDAATLDISGNADIDGTLEADAITVNGTALNTVIAGVTVTNASTAAVATTVTITDNESTDENNALIFTAGGDVDGGDLGLESDGTLTYNPSTGVVTATGFAGTLTGNVTGNVSGTAATVTGAAQGNITSLGTLTSLDISGDATVGDDLSLDSDAAVLNFGANSEIKVIHAHDSGLNFKHTATADDKPFTLTLQTGETDIAANDVLGVINFQAPDEATGTDAILVAAGIAAVSEGDFSASSNATKLSFRTGASETATEKMSLSSGGNLSFPDDGKVIFGAGDDLQIYHDGSNSYIHDAGTGGLYLRGSNEIALRSSSNENIFLGLTDGSAYVYHNGNVKLATTSTGIDVTGTATMDGLTVDVNSGSAEFIDSGTTAADAPQILIGNGDTSARSGLIRNYNDASNFEIIASASTTADKNLVFRTVDDAAETRLKIASNGDISFFEDTGSTAKFFWDSSAERLGIGTTSPASEVDISKASGGDATLSITSAGVQRHQIIQKGTGDGGLVFFNQTANAERLKIDSSGNVGIGCSPNARFSIGISGTQTAPVFILGNDADTGLFRPADNSLAVTTAGSERLRIDSSGNVIIAAGTGTLQTATAGTSNVRFGVNAGNSIVSGGNQNTVVGDEAGTAITTGFSNTAIGKDALAATTTGNTNTAVGVDALTTNTVGDKSTAVGYQALKTQNPASNVDMYNVAVGFDAGLSVTTGVQNTLIGGLCGDNITTGDGNSMIGYNLGNSAVGVDQEVVIGSNINGGGTNTVRIGTSAGNATLNLDGSDTSWAAASDERLKKDIVNSTVGLSFINALRPVTFKWNAKDAVANTLPQYDADSSDPVYGVGKAHYGFIAQEVKAVIDANSDVVNGHNIWVEDPDGTQQVAPSALIPILVKAIQELTARIETLEG